ncbi:MAG: hypothetical protein HY303_02195 [Candidatus Wallbacteria bacterium]|nr:hypothetical protein [Candidatus Wallbacteria bacterium]
MQLFKGSLVLLLGLFLVVGGAFAGDTAKATLTDNGAQVSAAAPAAPCAAACPEAKKETCGSSCEKADACCKHECPKHECGKNEHCAQGSSGAHFNKDCAKPCHECGGCHHDCCNETCGDAHKCGETHKCGEHHEQCHWFDGCGHHGCCHHHHDCCCGNDHCHMGACADKGCHGWYQCGHRHWTSGEETLAR